MWQKCRRYSTGNRARCICSKTLKIWWSFRKNNLQVNDCPAGVRLLNCFVNRSSKDWNLFRPGSSIIGDHIFLGECLYFQKVLLKYWRHDDQTMAFIPCSSLTYAYLINPYCLANACNVMKGRLFLKASRESNVSHVCWACVCHCYCFLAIIFRE